VRELLLLGGRREGFEGGGGEMEAPASFEPRAGGAPRRPAAPAPAAGGRAKQPAASNGGGGDDFEDFPNALEDEDDDLPF
jgi:single-strand DNA-binding protein